MANLLTGKVWALDTTDGLVTNSPVPIHKIRVTWNTASAGSVSISTSNSADIILYAETIALASGNRGQLTQEFSMGDQTYSGLRKILTVGLTTIQVITAIPK